MINDRMEKQAIMQATDSKVKSCSCAKCQNMCKSTPCLGTPLDILKLIHAGYIDKLSPTLWAAGAIIGIPSIAMFQPERKEDNSCVFFTDKGLCALHDKGLKPTEGQLADCARYDIENPTHKPLPFVVAETWVAKRNEAVIMEIIRLFKKHKGV